MWLRMDRFLDQLNSVSHFTYSTVCMQRCLKVFLNWYGNGFPAAENQTPAGAWVCNTYNISSTQLSAIAFCIFYIGATQNDIQEVALAASAFSLILSSSLPLTSGHSF